MLRMLKMRLHDQPDPLAVGFEHHPYGPREIPSPQTNEHIDHVAHLIVVVIVKQDLPSRESGTSPARDRTHGWRTRATAFRGDGLGGALRHGRMGPERKRGDEETGPHPRENESAEPPVHDDLPELCACFKPLVGIFTGSGCMNGIDDGAEPSAPEVGKHLSELIHVPHRRTENRKLVPEDPRKVGRGIRTGSAPAGDIDPATCERLHSGKVDRLPDRIGADVDTPSSSEASDLTGEIDTLVENALIGAEFHGPIKLLPAATRHDHPTTHHLRDTEAGQRHPPTDAGHEDRRTRAHSSSSDEHPPGGEVNESESGRLDGIGIADVEHVADGRHEELRHRAGDMLADHEDVGRRGYDIRLRRDGNRDACIEDHSSPDPAFVHPISHGLDDADTIRTRDCRKGAFKTRQATTHPEVELVQGGCLGSNQDLARAGRRRIPFRIQQDIVGDGNTLTTDFNGFHARQSTRRGRARATWCHALPGLVASTCPEPSRKRQVNQIRTRSRRSIDLLACPAACLLALFGSIGCDDSSETTPKTGDAGSTRMEAAPSPPAGGGAPGGSTGSSQSTAQGSSGQTPQAGYPPIVATPQMVDFGIVEPGSTLESDVTLVNTSDRPVRIMKAQPTCTCTTVDMTNVIIPARGSVQMPISMTTNRALGKKIARVQLIIEGYPRFLTVGLNAENALAIRAIPPYLPVKEKADQPDRRIGQFMIESVDKRPFRVLNVLTEQPVFLDFDPATDEPRNRYTLKYDLSGYGCEDLPRFLIIRTDHPKAPLMDLRIRHNPCTKIQTSMPMADFRSNLGLVKPGSSMEVQVEFKKPRRPVMASVRSDDPRASARILDQTSDGTQLNVVVEVTFAPDLEEGLFQFPIIFSDGTLSDEHTIYGWSTP